MRSVVLKEAGFWGTMSPHPIQDFAVTNPTPESTALFYTEGSSDKEYRVELRDLGDGTWMTLGFNGRRGSTLKEQKKTPTPVDYATAKAVYDKTLKGKLKDGYTPDQSGAVYQSTDLSDRFTGFVPQLLNSLRKPSDLEVVITDSAYIAQEKHDGERRPILIKSKDIKGLNKEGLVVSLPMNVADTLAELGQNMLIDGEIIGERYVAFDLLEIGGEDLRSKPYNERLARLSGLLAPKQGTVELVNTARTTAAKRHLFEALKDHRAEGVVFKRADAHYAPGRPASGGSQMKWKFTENCTVRVASCSTKKRSVAIECLGNDGVSVIPMGNVTIPSNADVPAVGTIVNVGYLYLYDGGSLFQPTYQGVRTDQSLPDQLHQFKLKNTVAFVAEDAAPPAPKRRAKAA